MPTEFPFRSPARKLAQFFRSSRDKWKAKAERYKTECRKLSNQVRAVEASREKWREAAQQAKQAAKAAEKELRRVRQELGEPKKKGGLVPVNPPAFPASPASADRLFAHHYRVSTILLFLRLVLLANCSFRGAAKVFQILLAVVGEMLGAPTANSGRMWLMRLGLYELRRPLPHAEDWIWIVDHTVQIGSQRCLVIVAAQPSELDGDLSPNLADLSVISIEPVTHSNADVIQSQLDDAVQRTGVPRAILSDGCPQLKKGIVQFAERHPGVASTYDIKHKTALILKKSLNADSRWREFNTAVGKARQATLPTSLAHLIPPAAKSKARYMNLGPLISWAESMMAYVNDPFPPGPGEACDRGLINIHYKWILDYQQDIAEWSRQIRILETATEHCRRHGYYREMTARLRPTLLQIAHGQRSRSTADAVLEFLEQQSDSAREGEALIATSESIESMFSKGKHLQGQQSASGFTSLVLGFAATVVRQTAETVRNAMAAVTTADVLQWARKKIGMTVQAKRKNTLGKVAAEQNQRKQPLLRAA